MARRIQVDERTENMPLEVLTCRRLGHAWEERPQGRRRRRNAELREQGLEQSVLRCTRCTLTMVETVDQDTWEVISRTPEGGYPPGYLVPRGSGRLPRAEARKAYAARRGRS